jgi:DNA replication protein DnaC
MDRIDDKVSVIRSSAKRLRLSCLTTGAYDVLLEAQRTSPSYDDFLISVLDAEVKCREERQRAMRYKVARLPMAHDLDMYDYSLSNGLNATQLRQLRELHWVEEGFNLMLAGPCGVGKTYIAAGLCADAIECGYKVYFRSMDEILTVLKTKDLTANTRKEYKNLCAGQIIAIDDLMNIAVGREDGNLLFAFINAVYESTSFIITTNRSPVEWAQSLNDEVLATALLDRLLYKCELIQLSGKSYRMKNRKTIFKENNVD